MGRKVGADHGHLFKFAKLFSLMYKGLSSIFYLRTGSFRLDWLCWRGSVWWE